MLLLLYYEKERNISNALEGAAEKSLNSLEKSLFAALNKKEKKNEILMLKTIKLKNLHFSKETLSCRWTSKKKDAVQNV